jgi:hypothetical protein
MVGYRKRLGEMGNIHTILIETSEVTRRLGGVGVGYGWRENIIKAEHKTVKCEDKDFIYLDKKMGLL